MEERTCSGLTLVELLIVLAIVLVLMAIAVPEYIEGRVVSKIARTHSDLRRIQTALDSYFLDFGVYPPSHDTSDHSQNGFEYLVSPFPYLKEIPLDPLSIGYYGDPMEYEGGSKGFWRAQARMGYLHDGVSVSRCIHAYLVIGVGPDGNESVNGKDSFPGSKRPLEKVIITSYSPTNGFESRGDVFRMTGAYKEGYVILDGSTLGG